MRAVSKGKKGKDKYHQQRTQSKAPKRKLIIELEKIEALSVEVQDLKEMTSLLKSEVSRLSEVNDFLESQITDLKNYFENKHRVTVNDIEELNAEIKETSVLIERLTRDLQLMEKQPPPKKIMMPPPITSQLIIYKGEEPVVFQVGVVPGIVEKVIEDARSYVKRDEKPDEEIVGVLVGRVVGNTVVIEEAVAGRTSYSGLTEVALDPNNLAEIIDRIMREGKNRRIVGWYHSHLGLGVFLSDVDVKTQLILQQFSYVIALVVDPIKNEFGFFYVDKESKLPDNRPKIIKFLIKE